MEIIDEIKQWLNSRQDYEAGAKLYLVHGRDHALRKVFSEPESPFKKKKLIEALTALLQKGVQQQQTIKDTKQKAIEHISVSPRKWPKPESRDATLQALHQKWKPVFAEMMSLTARIYDVAKQGMTDPAMKQEAGRMAHRILDLDDACDEIYRKRDHYLQYSKMPEDKGPMELVVDVKKIPLALSNAQRYISDYKNKLKKDPGNVKAAERLKKYQWAVAQYRKILNIDL